MEGSPGVGKTSLIIALGKYSGHKVVRINLSEQVSDSPSSPPLSFTCTYHFLSLFPSPNILSGRTNVLLFAMQSDLMDLLGSDLPVESDEGMKFAWSDGILLQVSIC